MGQPDHTDVVIDLCLSLGAAQLGKDRVNRKADIAANGEPRHQGIALKDQAAFGAWTGDGRTLEDHAARVRHFKTRDQVHQRGFSGAGKPQNGYELTLFDLEVDVFENINVAGALAKAFRDVFELENAHVGLPVLCKGEHGLQGVHHAIQQEADDADGKDRNHDFRERL